ncbi:hypothetical protein ABZ901_08315 [Actinacidiphila alni]|uniref:hypothetical protein n=1 Tax=Actinacidiphila alni TaxID=380248 RepID=UPI0033E9EA96
MTEMAELIGGEPSFWLSELPRYQQSTIADMLGSGLSFEQAASAWLSGAVAETTAPFGVGSVAKLYFESFLDELHDYLCVGKNYEEERKKLLNGIKPGQTGAVVWISTEIAPRLDGAPSFVAPAIALSLCMIAKMGLGAWCRLQSERRNSDTPEGRSDSPQGQPE